MNRIFFLISFFSTIAFCQFKPLNYVLLENKALMKTSVSGPTQIGNSISDIIISGDTILLGTNKGLSISSNNGKTWENFYGDNTFGSEAVSGLELKGNFIYCATAHSVEKDNQSLPEGSGIKISSDFGRNWISVPQPVDNKDSNKVIYGINTLKALPITTTISNITYDIAVTKNTIWIVSFAGGLRKSTNLGTTWERVVIPPDYLSFIKPTDSLKFDLSPSGGSLGFENNYNHRVFSVFAESDSILWVGTADGINKSTDGGISWQKFNHQNNKEFSGNFVVAINGKKINGLSYIFAATWKANDTSEFYGVSFTSDGGNTWSNTRKGDKIQNLGFYQDIVYLTGDNGLYRSSDLCNTWIQAPQIVDEVTKQRLNSNSFYAVNSHNDRTIWVGSSDGLAKTKETGAPWASPWRISVHFTPVSSATDTYAYPNPFNPEFDFCNIKYTTDKTDAKVTIRIYNFDFLIVRTLIQDAQRFGKVDELIQQTETWNGKTDAGLYVPNGVYFYSVVINDNKPIFGKIIVIR